MESYAVFVREIAAATQADGRTVRITNPRRDLKFADSSSHVAAGYHSEALRLSKARFLDAHATSFSVVSAHVMSAVPPGVKADHAIMLTVEPATARSGRQAKLAELLAVQGPVARTVAAEHLRRVNAPYSEKLKQLQAERDSILAAAVPSNATRREREARRRGVR